MTIVIRRVTGEAFEALEVLAGRHRLTAALRVLGKVAVTDADTGESFEVHEVDGQVVALQSPRQAAAEVVAIEAIERAAEP